MSVSLWRASRVLAASLFVVSCSLPSDVSHRQPSAAEPSRVPTVAQSDSRSVAQSAVPSVTQVDDEIGRIRAKLFERVNYPLLMRRLDSEIELAKAEIQMHRRVVSELDRFHRMAHESKPFLVTIEEMKLKQLAAELRLDDLEEERCLLQKYQRDERRLRELEARRDGVRVRR